MSLRRLLLWTAVDLLLVFVIGTLCYAVTVRFFMFHDPEYVCYRGLMGIGIQPQALGLGDAFEKSKQRWRHDVYQDCTSAPGDDTALEAYLKQQPELSYIRVVRSSALGDKGEALIRVEYDYSGAPDQKPPAVPWKQLGYTLEVEDRPYWAWVRRPPDSVYIAPDSEFRLLYIAWLQLGVFLVALVRMFFNRKLELPTPTARDAKSALLGLLVGALAFGLYWCYDQYLIHHVGPPSDVSGAVHTVPSVGWNIPMPTAVDNSVRPHQVLMVGIVVIALGAPLAQEMYLRSGVQAMWTGSKRPWLGVVVTTIIGTLILVDWRHWPLAIPIGFALGWLYRRTGSMLAPLVAHLVLNMSVVCLIFGTIDGLDHPSKRLPGRWEQVGARTELFPGGVISLQMPTEPVEFERGGAMRGNLFSTSGRYLPRRFEWVAPDTIRVRYQHMSQLDNRRHLLHQPVLVDYRVEVGEVELTLTPLTPGGPYTEPVRFRRKI